MMWSRFVRPDTVTLTLGNGDTVLVKRRLTSGEQRAAFARIYIAGKGGDGAYGVDPLATGIGLVTAYLVDWSFTDEEGARVPIRGLSVEALTAVLDALDPDSFTEIKEAIEAHEATVRAERDAQKKIRDGVPSSDQTSLSPFAPDSLSEKSEVLT